MKAGFDLVGLQGIGAGSLREFVHLFMQLQQVLVSIYVDGPIRTAAANIMPLMYQHTIELKC